MMKNLYKSLLTMLFLAAIFCTVGCNKKREKTLLVDSGFCPRYNENSDFTYTNNMELIFKLEVVVLREYLIDEPLLLETINKRFKKGGLGFVLTDHVYYPVTDTIMSYSKLFDDNYKGKSIQIIVIPDNLIFYENTSPNLLGRANNIPTIKNPSLAKPQLFIRESLIYTDILNHELGHVFGLFHTFHGNDTYNKGQNCDTGDQIATTITPEEGSIVYMDNCEIVLPKDVEHIYTEEDKKNMVINIESYSPDVCMTEFNDEQFARMRAIINVNSRLQDAMLKIIPRNIKNKQ